MPKAKIKNIKIEAENTIDDVKDLLPPLSEKEQLLNLYKTLKDLGINSIGDLENKIARAE